jgi:hypothetical protein
MKSTARTPFRTVYTTVYTHVQRLRHCLASWPHMGLLTTAGAMVPQRADALGVWGYRKAGLDVRSDRDIDSIFFRRNT